MRLLQPARGYRVALDAVLLAAVVPVRAGARVLDVGCGVGAAALCLLARAATAAVTDVHVVGLEAQDQLASLARLNAQRNALADWLQIVAGDVAEPPTCLGLFDHVMTNPPFLPAARADPSPDRSKALATVESTADLAGWLAFCLRILRPGGTLNLVHRADRQAEIIEAIGPEAHEVVVLPLLPRPGMPAKRLILRARKGAGGSVRVLPGFVLHRADGGYTEAAESVLRHATALDLG